MAENPIESLYLNELHIRMIGQIERAKSLVGNLSVEQLNWKPSAKAWSVGECLEHLHITIGFYLDKMTDAIAMARTRDAGKLSSSEGKHTIAGRFLLRAVEPSAKAKSKTFKTFTFQGSSVASDILARFTQSHENFASLMTECNGLDLSRVKLSSPISSFIRLNGNDAFEINVTHMERHLNQAERVLHSADFPR